MAAAVRGAARGGQAPAPEADPAGEPQAQTTAGADPYGISEDATEINQAISGAGLTARELARPTISADRTVVVDRMASYLGENERVLPAPLVEAAREDLQSIRDAVEAGDAAAAMAAGQALVETLRAAAPVGGEISGS
ncbi:hypothetical protein PF049_00815 [Erythrobacteraceae bacterium WH01K]|nr:hypothetical protein PF049_00815 [Erythrobacteraceae bacterium WH01K]